MLRKFTKTVGRFEKGTVKDYPPATWAAIQDSAGRPLNEFTTLQIENENQGVNENDPTNRRNASAPKGRARGN